MKLKTTDILPLFTTMRYKQLIGLKLCTISSSSETPTHSENHLMLNLKKMPFRCKQRTCSTFALFTVMFTHVN